MRYIVCLLLFPTFLNGQSLSKERVLKIKESTVRVIVEGNISIGTAFFINNKGTAITCWHVALPAFQNGKKIFIELHNGEKIEYGLPTVLANDTVFLRKAVAYDFCILIPVKPLINKVPFLKVGDYETANEGDEIYTCGYPLGARQQFISKGMISTKYVNDSNYVINLNKYYRFPRNEALLDITSNMGNSGGAIIKIGKTIAEDVVIGFADFIVSPIGYKADSIITALSPAKTKGRITFNTFDSSGTISSLNINDISTLFAQSLKNVSIGVSGCVSINHLHDFLKPNN